MLTTWSFGSLDIIRTSKVSFGQSGEHNNRELSKFHITFFQEFIKQNTTPTEACNLDITRDRTDPYNFSHRAYPGAKAFVGEPFTPSPI